MANISLSDGEWKIMKVLWSESPRTIGQIVELLDKETGWSKTTVFVMLKRLIAKGAVRMDDSERLQHYYPLISRKDVAPEETDSFLSRVYDGSIGMMVSSLAGRKALSAEDIAELRRILDEAEKNK
ncbi:MAG: BlaI/MecI/CopY family transcriptional regulator [Clostridia bacterium]|nr:BlaI/MecI/CopY family transcriptional regulator [Clostridia bacterium]